MSNLSQNTKDKLDYTNNNLSPSHIHSIIGIIHDYFKEIYIADGGDDTIEIFNYEHNIIDFDIYQLVRYITPKQCNYFTYSIDEDYDKALKIYLECQALYITSDENIPDQGNNYAI